MNTEVNLETITSLCKRRGFIYQGSEVYGGLSGTWDYGPLGVILKRNIMNLWWKTFVDDREDMYGVDAAIIMNQKVWQASGHVDTFTDPLVECTNCHSRYRTDHIIPKEGAVKIDALNTIVAGIKNDFFSKKGNEYPLQTVSRLINQYRVGDHAADSRRLFAEKYSVLQFPGGHRLLEDYIFNIFNIINHALEKERDINNIDQVALSEEILNQNWDDLAERLYLSKHIKCPNCGDKQWTASREFNMMFKTHVGPVADEKSISYLRPETAQGIFTNYKNVVDSFYPDLPFGIAQQGKAFRNEISPRDFVFRSREFEQMEVEYFIDPADWEKLFEQWQKDIKAFLASLGLPENSIHEVEVLEEDRAHYSERTVDYDLDFPHGKDELLGLAYRTDFDLMNIQNASKKSMEYTIKGTNTKFVPHVIEPSFGVERALMAVLCAAYQEDEQNGEKRVYLALPEHLAPYKFCVSPLLKNKPELVEKAREVFQQMKAKYGNVTWDDNGNIGKRYRRQDEIGTPNCIVIDFDTLEDDTVTVRNRDTTEQKRVKISDL